MEDEVGGRVEGVGRLISVVGIADVWVAVVLAMVWLESPSASKSSYSVLPFRFPNLSPKLATPHTHKKGLQKQTLLPRRFYKPWGQEDVRRRR